MSVKITNSMKTNKMSYAVIVLAIAAALMSVGFGKKEKTFDDLTQITGAGANLVIDATGRDSDDLMRLAAVCRGSRHTLHLKNCSSFATADLMRIAAVGNGYVVMEF